jgi:hypothetical protein
MDNATIGRVDHRMNHAKTDEEEWALGNVSERRPAP